MTTTAPSIGTAAILSALQAQHDRITPGGSHPNREWGDIHRDGMRDGVQKAIEQVKNLSSLPVAVAETSQPTPAAWLINDGHNAPYATVRQVDADEAREEGWNVQPLVPADLLPKADPIAP